MESLQPVLQTMLPKDDYEWLSSHPRPTWGITSRLRQIVNTVKNSVTGDFWVAHSLLEQGIGELESIAGICERILGSPIPPTYSRHLSRVMTLWLSVLPLGLLGSGVPTVGTILATAFIAYVMIGLDELGMELELPFPLLPLQQLCAATQQGVAMQLTGTPEASPYVEMPQVRL
jgi:predicted membrane chloride channel (bestrophin family)